MASILLLSEKGKILPIGGRLRNEGHIVKVWFRDNLEGVLKGSRNPSRVMSPTSMLEQYDLVLMEPKLGQEFEKVKESNKPILGCNSIVGRLQNDLEYKRKVMQYLLGKQEELEGLEVRVFSWITPMGLSPICLLAMKVNRFMDGDKGIQTEGMGSLTLALKEGDPLIKLLHPFTEFLQKANYLGPITVNAKVKGDLCYTKDIEIGFDPLDTLAGCEMLKTSLFEFLFDLTEKGKEGKVWEGLGISVLLSIPPWPHGNAFTEGDYLNVPEPARKHFSIADPRLGILGVASSRGQDVREARRRVYRTINNSVVSKDCQFRGDIGLIAEDDMITLREWGWLT